MKINQNGKLYKDFGFFGNMIALNLCFVVGCLPIFTIGASSSALSKISLQLINKQPTMIVPEFFDAFKENFKQSTYMFLIYLAFGAMMVFNIVVMKDSGNSFFDAYRIMMLIFLFVLILLSLYTWPLIASFENDIPTTFKNAFMLMFKNYFQSIRVILLLVIVLLITFYSQNVFTWMIGFYIFIGFALVAYGICIPINRVLQKYMPEDEYKDWVDPYAHLEKKE